MKHARINKEQHIELWQQPCAEGKVFNPTVDKFGDFFISEDEINSCTNQDLIWVKDLPLIDLDTVKPVLTPPASNGKGLVITTKFQWVFPFRLNGFKIVMKDQNGTKYVEKSTLTWPEFQKELDKPQNDDIRLMLKPLIDYLKDTTVQINV